MPTSSFPNSAPESVLQIKMRLLGVSPMVWRRILISEASSLRELHGMIQAAMGWSGIHLFEFDIRGVRYAAPELCAESLEVTLADFRFRKNATFRYIYDMSDRWDHEIRIEDRRIAEPRKRYPTCIGGAHACPPEDCGGPDGCLARRDEASSLDAMEDLTILADFVEQAVLNGDRSILEDDDIRWQIECAADRSRSRAAFLKSGFSRREVNSGFRQDEHRRLTHQQIM